MKRIKRFGVLQTAKIVSLMYFILIAVIMIPIGIISTLVSGLFGSTFPAFGGAMFFILPFVYGAVIFVMTALGCLVYNFVAQWTGGIEVEVEITEG